MEVASDNKQITDNALMLAYKDGDLPSFNTLYQRHRQTLYQFLVNRCSDEAVAAELFQDIWTRVINARHGYTDSAPFTAWLYRIARNRVTDHYRSHKAHTELDEEDSELNDAVTQLQTPLLPDEIADISAKTDALRHALATLPDEQNEAIQLRHLLGFGVDEIADLIGEKPETVKSRLRYALTKLRKQLRMLK